MRAECRGGGRAEVRVRTAREDLRAGRMMEGLEFHTAGLGLFGFSLEGVELLVCYNQGCVTSSVLRF